MVATRGGARTGTDDAAASTSDSKGSLRQKPLRTRAASKSEPTKTTAAKADASSTRTTRAHTAASTATGSTRSTRGANTRHSGGSQSTHQDDIASQDSASQRGGSVRTRRAATRHAQDDSAKDAAEQKPQAVASVRGKKSTADDGRDHVRTRATLSQALKARSARSKRPEPGDSTQDAGEGSGRTSRPATADTTKSARTTTRAARNEHVASSGPHTASRAASSTSNTRSTRAKSSQSQPLSPKKITQMAKAKPDATKAQTWSKGTSAATRRSARSNISDENDEVENPSEAKLQQTTTTTAPRKTLRTTKRTVPLRPATPDTVSSMSSRATTPSDSPIPVFEQPKNLVEDEADARDSMEASDKEEDAEDEHNMDDSKKGSLDSEDELAGPKTPMRRSGRSIARTRAADKRKASTQPSLQDKSSIQPSKLDQPAVQLQDALEDASQPDAEPEDLQVTASHGTTLDPLPDADHTSPEPDYSIVVDEEMFPSFETDPPVEAADIALDAALQDDIADQHMHDDPNETLVIEDDQPEASSLLSDNSVVRYPLLKVETEDTKAGDAVDGQDQRDVSDLRDDEEDEEYTRLSLNPKTPKPETINWYNVEPNTVLRETLDLGLSPNVEHSQLGVMPDVILSSPTKQAIAEEVAEQVRSDRDDAGDDTVEFTEFVTMSGVNEQPEVLTANQPSPDDGQPVAGTAAHDVEQHPQPDRDHDRHDGETSRSLAEQAEAASTSLQSLNISERDGSPESPKVISASGDTTLPHYMQPTFAFDARRRTLPARPLSTPVKSAARPNTSDGAGLWDPSHAQADFQFIRPRSQAAGRSQRATLTPVTARRSLAPFSIASKQVKRDIVAEPRRDMPNTPSRGTPSIRSNLLRSQMPNTVAGYSRFRSDIDTPASRQRTSNIRNALQRMAVDNGRRLVGRSPARTPLKSITGSPGVTAMALHPAMPLRGVVAIVEVYTCEGASASAPFVTLLHRLGAKTTKIWSDRVTHVVFKDGSPTTLQRVALHNKRVARGASGSTVYCVNSRWVSDCDSQSTRVTESDEAYVVSTDGIPGSARRKRKSMEPTTMVNLDGQLVRDRNSSWGRSSSGRFSFSATPSRTGSPAPYPESMVQTPMDNNVGVGGLDKASPATPTWIAAPTRLVQATAPVKRIRRLQPVGGIKLSSRRMTHWNHE